MAPSSAVRSFAITSAIVIALIGPQATGFTVHRSNSITPSDLTTDLVSEESFHLQVKNDLRKTNYIKSEKNERSHGATKNLNSIVTDKTNSMINHTSVLVENETIPVDTRTGDIATTTENVKIVTISSDTVEVFDSVEDKTEYGGGGQTTSQASNNHGSESTTRQFNLTQFMKTTDNEMISTTEVSTATQQEGTESERILGLTTQKEIAESIPEIVNDEMTSKMIVTTETDTPKENVLISASTPDTEKLDDMISESTTSESLATNEEIITTSPDQEPTSTIADVLNDIPPFLGSTTETIIEDSTTQTTEPSWKKYTTIVRKRVTSTEDTSQTTTTDNDAMQAETSNSYMNFENALNVTPISSLESSTIDLISNTNIPSTFNNEVASEEAAKTTTILDSTTPYINPVSTEDKRTATFETKRAGFLDFSGKVSTSRDMDYIKIDNVKDEKNEPEIEKFVKNNTTESQIQLAEDVIQEELLKEETLNNEENVNRYKDVHSKTEEANALNVDTPNESSALSAPIDALSVQPINHERRTTLYTVSPNYKPMKKIDVQPSKPFVRDPDDNSWRNESISSLGIVFKPKNSSKSFKEVLKNKTQVELSNLQGRYNKDDVPDLRVRLEKIAEVRKTKKKRPISDGEETYGDYEEGSRESDKTKPAPVSSVINSGEIHKEVTKTQYSEGETTPMDAVNELNEDKAKEITTQELMKSLGLDPLTTLKPKNFFNIAEYYDTTDEYDADYVTMSKLDLKKFTPPAKPTEAPISTHVEPPPTKLMQSYYSDRKPTVQYFPPRPPQKVSVNNLDEDFERKINLFTIKDAKPDLGPPFTESPMVATDMPATPEMKPTMKTTDFDEFSGPHTTKNVFLANAPRNEPHSALVLNNANVNRGSYVIKHYRDFLDAAVKDSVDEKYPDFVPYTDTPARGATVNDLQRGFGKGKDEEYDYDSQFRREVLTRFIDNFNQNSERFKVDFPILYNSSVVHRTSGDGSPGAASSRAFLKRLYHNEVTTRRDPLAKKPCEPNCELTVELSPAYELHYYVPGQEEQEQPNQPPPPSNLQRYRL